MIEITRNRDCRNWYVSNHSDKPILYAIPGLATSVWIPAGQMLYMWMNEEQTKPDQWHLTPLNNPPTFV